MHALSILYVITMQYIHVDIAIVYTLYTSTAEEHW